MSTLLKERPVRDQNSSNQKGQQKNGGTLNKGKEERKTPSQTFTNSLIVKRPRNNK